MWPMLFYTVLFLIKVRDLPLTRLILEDLSALILVHSFWFNL